GSLAQARKSLAREHFDMVLLDISLPDGSGLELLDELHAQYPQLPVVVLSANELPAARLGQVHSVLAKSRTDSNHFLGLLSRLLTAKENQDV
ncbi:response regulator, partial [Pseudomonas sp.]